MESNQNILPRPAAAYQGGKSRLAKQIVTRIAGIEHATYAEPFVGMGGVFLRRAAPAKSEVINDISRDVITFFRILQRHFAPFMDMLRYQLTSRAEFERLLAVKAETLTDLERAARFLYLQRLAFGGMVGRRSFGVSVGAPARFDVTKLAPNLAMLAERLSAVIIENMHWQSFIDHYDRPGTLFYLDPPYFGSEKDYGKDVFCRGDFEAMAHVLSGLKGRFVLSLNDLPETRAIFREFSIQGVETTYSLGQASGKSKRARELIISN